MPSLDPNGAEISRQDDFADALFDPNLPTPNGIINPDGKTASKRFDVYRNNVISSLSGALGEGFPIVRTLVGDEFFDHMARAFVRAHPPETPLMFEYGEAFPEFIAHFEAASSLPYLADIARLEMHKRRAYFAADTKDLAPDWFAKAAQDALGAMRIMPKPSTFALASPYPIYDIYRHHNGASGSIEQVSQEVLVVREEGEVIVLHAPNGTKALLKRLESLRFGDALEASVLANPDQAFAEMIPLILTHSMPMEKQNQTSTDQEAKQ